MTRDRKHNSEGFPLSGKEEIEMLRIQERLLTAWRRWGGSVAEWADGVGVSDRTVRRWINGELDGIKAENLDATRELFGVSRKYVMDGIVYHRGLDMPTWEPTSAEPDRYDDKRLVRAYSRLSDDEQRTVTKVIDGLLTAKKMTARADYFVSKYMWLSERVIYDELTDEEFQELQEQVEADELINEQIQEWEEHQERDELLASIERLKEGKPDSEQGSDEDA